MTTNLNAREAWTTPLSQLERYAGWLGKDQVSVAVRADVKALGAAMDAGSETSLLLFTLDQNIGRLPSGDVRKIVRKALTEIRAVLEPSDVDPYENDRAKRIVKD
jgi:hypothetical protein